jgi:hypothetical protein
LDSPDGDDDSHAMAPTATAWRPQSRQRRLARWPRDDESPVDVRTTAPTDGDDPTLTVTLERQKRDDRVAAMTANDDDPDINMKTSRWLPRNDDKRRCRAAAA